MRSLPIVNGQDSGENSSQRGRKARTNSNLEAWPRRGRTSLCLILTAPIMLVVAVCVRITMGSPVFFRQSRPGLGGRLFVLYKFRTMRVGDDLGSSSDEYRITRLGAFLRKTSLDELPELWNVLRGEMSLVGPRPLLMHYLDRYTAEQARRHEMKPGLTGWSQVNGRNALSWADKLAMDVWYVDHWSLRLDLRILALTI